MNPYESMISSAIDTFIIATIAVWFGGWLSCTQIANSILSAGR